MPFIFQGNQETEPHLPPLTNFLQSNFCNNENKVEMDEIDERLKVNIHSILDTISDETINGIIHALKYAGLESLSDLKFVQEEDLILVLKPIPRRKLINAWRDQTKPPCPPIPQHNNHFSNSNSCSPHSSLPPSVCLSANAVLTSTPVSLQNCQPSSNYSPPVKNYLPLQKFKWKRKKKLALLQVYAKYKAVLVNAGEEKFDIWYRISKEIGQKYNSDCHMGECFEKIEELKAEYEKLKTKPTLNKAETELFIEAENAFEIAENLDKSQCSPAPPLPGSSVAFSDSSFPPLPSHNDRFSDSNNVSPHHSFLPSVSFAANALLNSSPAALQNNLPPSNNSSFVKPSNLPPEKFKWKNKRKLALLQIYAKYKTEFANSGVEMPEVWQKIAKEVGKKYNSHCDIKDCVEQIEKLRSRYEMLKTKSMLSIADTKLYNEAKYAFETAENLESYLTNFRRNLLRVYAKYKSQLDCPATEQQKVWEKIVRELKEQHSYSCGESLCQFELSELKSEYEDLKKDDAKKENVPYFEDARRAFENLELSNSEINEEKKTAGKYLPPHLRSEKK